LLFFLFSLLAVSPIGRKKSAIVIGFLLPEAPASRLPVPSIVIFIIIVIVTVAAQK
jgi:hypothetical protein